ncbi:MAG: flagellar motor switch protein FliN [Aquificota bacterium]|nr:MAG: flagellar motor switch protein FliN [Aquificota bacterium]
MEEKKIEENNESIDQEKLAEQWAQMAEVGEEKSEEFQEVNQEKLAEEWAKAAESQETVEEEKKELTEKETLALEKEKLDIFMDIPLEISVEIGNTELPLEEILRLAPNSIVELDKFINQPVDLKVNGKLVAKGELYTVENNFAIKITSIITAQERLKLFSEEFE